MLWFAFMFLICISSSLALLQALLVSLLYFVLEFLLFSVHVMIYEWLHGLVCGAVTNKSFECIMYGQ